MDVRTQPSHSGGYQAGLPTLHTTTTSQVGQGRAEGPDVLTHGYGSDESLVAQDREGGGCAVRVQGGAEYCTSHGGGARGGEGEKVGGHLDGSGLLCGSGGFSEKGGEMG